MSAGQGNAMAGGPAMRLSPEQLSELRASWQAVLDAEVRLAKARARHKIDEGTAELARQEHNERVALLLIAVGARPLSHQIDLDTGEVRPAGRAESA